ncbi:hypothetical protein CSV61_01825 [Sporosarcina sp. P3]|uniref:hypothetical protein n=1 Tax=Sporosarcina sp. P3 TaxID=2048245 RepID=UPI000C166ECA|nr:hypothetical protein [Sporosarcina sp. P3]PID23213.1 hypothetical protein CSV61_01825 [Sporosarcina sp. P3]
MVRNVPLLMTMLLVGSSALIIYLTTELPQLTEWLLLLVAVVLNTWSALALILHIGIQKLNSIQQQ